MATVTKEVQTRARPEQVWDAIRDIGALHTRLVPGFVTDTLLEPGARVVTFANGMTVREPIITLDDNTRRLVWSAEGNLTSHFNGAVQVHAGSAGGTRVVWTSDFLPDEAAVGIDEMMEAGAGAMRAALERLAGEG
jgi:carbon monoxide dehydrogenase subunit G